MSDESPKPRLFVRYVVQRIDKNKNFLAITTGSTGSGKSYAMLAFAEELSAVMGTPFTIDQVFFSVKEFLDALVVNECPRGTVYLLDEAGIMANSRQFMSVTNRALHFVAQSVRSYNNPIVLFTVPHAAFVDAGVRKLLHCHFETKGIDFRRKVVRTAPKMIQVNQQTGQAYYKYLRVRHPDAPKFVPLTRLMFGLPSRELSRAYEDKKQAYLEGLYRELSVDLGKMGDKADSKPRPDGRVVLSDRQQAVLELFKRGLTIAGVASELGTSRENISMIRKVLGKKGFVFKPRKKGVRVLGYDVVEPAQGWV